MHLRARTCWPGDWGDHVPFLGSQGAGAEGNGEVKAGWNAVKDEIVRRGIRSVSWSDWEVIDTEEKRRGQDKGKEREKCKSVAEMLRILDG